MLLALESENFHESRPSGLGFFPMAVADFSSSPATGINQYHGTLVLDMDRIGRKDE